MFTIKLMDKTKFEVSDSIADKLTRAIASNVQWVMISGNQYNTASIMSIEKSKKTIVDATQPLLAPPTTELSEERRQANLDRIAEMRRKFNNRH